jgi:cysteinyl-tRNA synthetase
MSPPRVSSSGLSRGSSDLRVSALVDGWMAGTSPAMTAVMEADRIRDELSAMGIQLKDAKDPATGETVTTWEVKR